MTTWPTVSRAEARELTDKIKQGLDAAEADIKRAHNVRAWQALGYPNWDIYCKTEFGLCMLRVPMEKRVEMVRSLEMHGLTYAEIGSAMGTSAATAWRDAKKAGSVSDETGPPKPKPRPRPDKYLKSFYQACAKVADGSLEIQRLCKNGKFDQYRDALVKDQKENVIFAHEQLEKLLPYFEDIPPIPLDESGGAA